MIDWSGKHPCLPKAGEAGCQPAISAKHEKMFASKGRSLQAGSLPLQSCKEVIFFLEKYNLSE